VSLLAALAGVVLIADVQLVAQPLGIMFALLAAGFWAGYVVLGKAVAVQENSLESLAVGWVIATLVTAPLLILIVTHWKSPDSVSRVVLMVVALAVLSSVIPYVLDQLVLQMVGRASFALLLALLPTTAVLVGFLVLGQVPTTPEVLGIALVVVALVISDHNA
jgi:inner membrane transporter RhtA